MHDLPFRHRLAARILGILGAAALVAEHASCSNSVHSPTGAGGAASHGSSTTTGTGSAVGTTGTTSTGAAIGAGGNMGTGGVSGMGGAGGAGGSIPPSPDCFGWPVPEVDDAGNPIDAGPIDAGPCPADPTTALNVFLAEGCPRGFEPKDVVSGPSSTSTASDCCYLVNLTVCGPGGRPYLVDDRARVATLVTMGAPAGGWTVRRRSPASCEALTRDERASLAEAWSAAALFEHASVASFARFSLELLAAGAPSDLVAAAHEAALDEIEHARLCFALASAYAGMDVAPGPFPLGGQVRLGAGLAGLAASTVVEGCVGETVAAVIAAEQLARATDPAARAALARIAADEARHAELAWRTVAWALRAGGSEVMAAVEQALVAALGAPSAAGGPSLASPGDDGGSARRSAELCPQTPGLEAHGLLDAATQAHLVASAMDDVVAPAARALLRQVTMGGAPKPPGRTSALFEHVSAG
jgi:hypothetical protein